MNTSFYAAVADAVSRGAVSLRFHDELAPTSGTGTPFSPPTYAVDERNPHRYAEWTAIVRDEKGDARKVQNVTIDSEGSQANRAEEGLSTLIGSDGIDIPVIELRVNDGASEPLESIRGERRFTNLTTPHRHLDPIFRFGLVSREKYAELHPDDDVSGLVDVEDGLVPFARTPLGESLVTAPENDLRTVLEYAPTSLLFGFWGSYSNGVANERPRLARRYASTIVGHDVFPVLAGSTKTALFNESKEVQLAAEGALFEVTNKGTNRASKIGAGAIPSSVIHRGYTAQRISWITTVSVRGLLQTPLGYYASFAQREAVACALLTLGIAGRAHADLMLRSGCDLALDQGESTVEWLFADGRTEDFSFDPSRQALAATFTDAKSTLATLGGPRIGSQADSIRLHLSPGYRELINKSNEIPSIFKDEA